MLWNWVRIELMLRLRQQNSKNDGQPSYYSHIKWRPHGGWKPKSMITCALLQFRVDYTSVLSARKVSAYHVEVWDAGFNRFEPASEWFITNIRAYSTIGKTMLKRVRVIYKKNKSDVLLLKLNVTGVKYNSSGEHVILKNWEFANRTTVPCVKHTGESGKGSKMKQSVLSSDEKRLGIRIRFSHIPVTCAVC